jgi:cation diffusion facilitator family transporter
LDKAEENRILRIQALSAFLIGSVMLLEISAGISTNSLAILGDGIHALYDFIITSMLLITYRIGIKPADESHTYGHSRIKTLGAFASGIAFLYLVVQLLIRSIDKLANPSTVHLSLMGFLALVYTLGVDFVRITALSRFSRRGETSVKAGLLHSLADFFDTLVAILGFLLAGYFNINQADAFAGFVLSTMMIYLGVKLLYETGMELTDTVPPTMVNKIRRIVEEEYGADGISYLNVRRVDRKTYVDVGAFVSKESSVSSTYKSVKEVEGKISRAIEGDSVVRIQTMPRGSESLYELIRSSALSIKGVLNVHEILVSKAGEKLLVSLHIEVPDSMSLTEAHKIADEVERRVSKSVGDIENIMVHLETAGSSVYSIETVGLDTSLYFMVEDVVRRGIEHFKNVRGIRRMLVFKSPSGSKRIELTVSMDGDASMYEAHETASRLEDVIKHNVGGDFEVVVHVEPSEESS